VTTDSNQQNTFAELSDVSPLDEGDIRCMNEIFEVLAKHQKTKRFGVSLLHKHFDLAPDEEIVEVTDVAARKMTKVPMKKGVIPEVEMRGTSWYLGADGPVIGDKCRSKWHA